MDTPPPTPVTKTTPPGPEPAKTFIRTLESDMAALKSGGIPEFTQIKKKLQAIVMPPASSSPILPPSILPPSGIPTPVPTPAPAVAPPPTPAPKARKSITIPLETYAGDFSDRVKETRASTATILAAEQDSAPPPDGEVLPQKSSRNGILYGIVGVTLLLAGGVGVYFAYGQYLSGTEPILLAPSMTAPIFVDNREQISGAGLVLVRAIQQSVARPLTSGTVRLLYLEATSTTGVFSALQEPAPGVLMRNINSPQSMVGVINVGGIQSPFVILSVTAYSETFAGMLMWEPTMPRDLYKLFPPYTEALNGRAASSTTTTSSTSRRAAGFLDITVANHDVRVYRDTSGRDILMYGYWNRTTLVIARDAAAFTEILSRIATSRAQ